MNESMDENEQTTVLTPEWIELAKIAQNSFFHRRQLEWRLSIGFWTAIGLFTYLFLGFDGIQTPKCFSCLLLIVYLVLFGLTIPFWHLPLHKAHAGDKRYQYYYIDKARKKCPCPENPDRKNTWSDVNQSWFFGHLTFTAIFLFLSWFMITQVALPTVEAKRLERMKQQSTPSTKSVKWRCYNETLTARLTSWSTNSAA